MAMDLPEVKGSYVLTMSDSASRAALLAEAT
jgi:hypothetical protein